jgi:hypothetical protein
VKEEIIIAFCYVISTALLVLFVREIAAKAQ